MNRLPCIDGIFFNGNEGCGRRAAVKSHPVRDISACGGSAVVGAEAGGHLTGGTTAWAIQPD